MVVYSPKEAREPDVVRNHDFRNHFVFGEADRNMSTRMTAMMGPLGDCGSGIDAVTDIRREM